MFKKAFVIFLKKLEIGSAIAVRLTKYTGKSNIPIHPKHLIKSKIWFARFLNKNDIVLDLGCNSGQISIKISKNVKKVIGFEIDKKLVKIANEEISREKVNNVEILIGDANKKLPFTSNYFDKVICSDVLEHLYKRHFALSEIKRVLIPGGILFLVTDNPNTSWKLFQKSHGLFYYADPDHKYEYPKEEILKLLKLNKYKIISINNVTYDTPFVGLIDLIGGISLFLYKNLRNWRERMVIRFPNETTGFRIIAKKI